MPRPHARPETAEEALRERDLLLRQYRRARNEYREQLYQRPGGEYLAQFALHLQRFGKQDATAMLRFVREQARGWLATAEPQMRIEAASLCNERIIQIRMRSGKEPFDDPLPGDTERDKIDVWQQCKQELL